jgi:hypothetical protein
MSKFAKWTLTQLDRRFGLEQIKTLPSLQHLLQHNESINDFEKQSLTLLQEWFTDRVDNWNEQELAMHFVGPVFGLMRFDNKNYNLFQERPLKGIVDGEIIDGYPDGIIAKGFREPEIPYFCFQEYKKQKDPNGDPAGQLLAAMLVAQTLNKAQTPIFGCYIIGRHWFLMSLEAKQYAITLQGYNATNNDLFEIFKIFKHLKKIIEKHINP